MFESQSVKQRCRALYPTTGCLQHVRKIKEACWKDGRVGRVTTLEHGTSAVTVWGSKGMFSMVLTFVKLCWVVDAT